MDGLVHDCSEQTAIENENQIHPDSSFRHLGSDGVRFALGDRLRLRITVILKLYGT